MTGTGEEIVPGLVLRSGIVAPVTLIAAFHPKPDAAGWFALCCGYHIIGLLLVSVILSRWT